MLFALNTAVSSIFLQILHGGGNKEYPGYRLYIMSAYAFYCITIAIISLVRYRKYKSPMLSAVKAINLTASLVTLLSLLTALSEHLVTGRAKKSSVVLLFGSLICLSILFIAVFMVVRAGKETRRFRKSVQKN